MTEPQDINRVHADSDFIARVPALLEYHPVDSLVVVPLVDSRSRGAIRIDLDADPAAAAATLTSMLCRLPDVTAAFLVSYAEDPRPDLVDAVAASFRAAGFLIQTRAHVSDAGWVDYTDLTAAPTPVPQAPRTAEVAGTQTTFTEPDVEPARAAALAAAVPGDPDLFELDLLIEKAVSPRDLHVDDQAQLANLLNRSIYRDVILIQWAAGPAAGEADIIIGIGKRPEQNRMMAALHTVTDLAAHLPEGQRAGAYTAAAWILWALGRSAAADAYAARAQADGLGCSLADFIRTVIERNHQPEWAFD